MTVAAITAGLKLASITLANLILIKNFIGKIRKLLKKGTSHLDEEEAALSQVSKIINKAIREAKPKPKEIKAKKNPDNNMNKNSQRDVKPQILTINTGTATAVDQYVSAQAVLPVPRFGSTKTKATIFELLWVNWYLAISEIQEALQSNWAWLSTVETRVTGSTSNIILAGVDVLNPRAFAFALRNKTLAVSGASNSIYPIHVDLTDSNGNGILIATDRIQITGGNAGGTNPSNYVAKVAYRLVDVGIQEYVGIISSQQGI